MTMTTATGLDVDTVVALYRRYAEPLRLAREAQRELLATDPRALRPKLDDVEAEITYLLLRELRPAAVVEIGTFHGWSTTWQLRALRDNGTGHLYSFDLVDHAVRSVPAELSGGRWTFTHGDVRKNLAALPNPVDYLFVDAAHTAPFARWYTEVLFPGLPAETPVSVHDIYHRGQPLPFSEGRVVLGWLADRKLPHFTAAPAHAPDVYEAIFAVKRELGLTAPVHASSRHNPMIYFSSAASR
jgi:predicted O-methyltransferase YrrM